MWLDDKVAEAFRGSLWETRILTVGENIQVVHCLLRYQRPPIDDDSMAIDIRHD